MIRLGPCFRVAAGLVLAAAAAHGAPAQDWDAFVSHFIDGIFTFQPDEAVNAGRHEFDGKLPDWSDAGLKKEIAWLHAQRAAAEAFPVAGLDARQRFDREHLIMEARGRLFWLEAADQPHTNPYFYADSIDPDTYVSRPYASPEVRLRAYIAYAEHVPAAIEQIKHNLDRPLARTLIEIGRTTIGGLAEFYQDDVPGVFASAGDPALQAEFRKANAGAIAAVKDLDAWLAAKEKGAGDNFALGPTLFRAMVRESEGVDLPPEKLQAIAQRNLERDLEAMRQACAAYAPGKPMREAARLALSHKPPGSVTEYAAKQLVDLRRFILDHDIVSIPGTEQAKVEPAPPYKAWNSAYINIPGPYEKGLPSVYYVSPPDPSWPKQKQEDYIPSIPVLLFTSAHEVYPGHFVQFLHAHRDASEFGQVFVCYSYAEGWAHYCEEMMWDAGLGHGSPEIHIGQIEEALLRDVRFLCSIGLHTQGMTVDQARQHFLHEGFQDEGDAEQQAKRGAFDPDYLSYTMGKLMIRKLREDWTATRGGRKAWKAFHDQFLQYGAPPIPLVRKAMMGSADPGSLF